MRGRRKLQTTTQEIVINGGNKSLPLIAGENSNA